MTKFTVIKHDGPLTVYELREEHTNSWLKVAPERGGIIFSLGIRGQEILYLDEETLFDFTANVRGGIPILFPIAGQLVHGQYTLNGKTYTMKNHGVARTNAWTVISIESTDYASMTIELSSTDVTRQEFPFDFTLRFKYILKDGTLSIQQTYINHSSDAMPMHAGFHPYFLAPSKHIIYDTDATAYLDYNNGEVRNFEGTVDLESLGPESITLLNAKQRQISFTIPSSRDMEGTSTTEDVRSITLTYGHEFRYVVLWTVAGKPFVCVEPWMAKNSELNRLDQSGDSNHHSELIWVQSEQPFTTFLTIG